MGLDLLMIGLVWCCGSNIIVSRGRGGVGFYKIFKFCALLLGSL